MAKFPHRAFRYGAYDPDTDTYLVPVAGALFRSSDVEYRVRFDVDQRPAGDRYMIRKTRAQGTAIVG